MDLSIDPISSPVSSGSTPIPDYSGVNKSAQEGFEKASQLLVEIGQQKQAQDNVDALISYKDKLAHLDEQVSTLQDPTAKISIYQAGQEDIKDQLQKEYPNLSPASKKAISYEMINDYREHFIRTTAEAKTNAGKDLAHFTKSTIRAATLAKSGAEQNTLLKNALNHYDDMAERGYITDAAAKDYKTAMVKAVHEADAARLANEHPETFLQTTSNSLNISPGKWHALAHDAIHPLDLAEEATKNKVDKAKWDAIAQLTPENADEWANNHPEYLSYAEAVKGHKIVMGEDLAAAHYSDSIKNASSPEEARELYREARARGVTGVGASNLANLATETEHRLTTELGKTAHRLRDQLHQQIRNSDKTYNTMKGTPEYTANVNWNSGLLEEAYDTLYSAKNVQEMHKYAHDLSKRITERYGLGTTITGPVGVESTSTEQTTDETDPNKD